MKLNECKPGDLVIFETNEKGETEISLVFYMVVEGKPIFDINIPVKRLAVIRGEPNFEKDKRYDYQPRYFKFFEEEKAVLSEADGRIEVVNCKLDDYDNRINFIVFWHNYELQNKQNI